jgi:hypothetical protein
VNTACRTELLQALSELSAVHPEVRLGQLVANLSYLARGPANESVWDAEDEELLAAAHHLLQQKSQGIATTAMEQAAKG